MNDLYTLGIVSLILSLGLTTAITPGARRWAVARGLLDRPGGRRLDRDPLPKGGGIAIYVSFWTVAAILLPINNQLIITWLATTVLMIVGLVDDRYELKWFIKLGGQLSAACILALAGERILFMTHPLSGESIFIGFWGVPLAIIWLVSLTNMINLIDGLDGLAAGVSAIVTVPLIIVAVMMGRFEAAFMAVTLAGASLGFLPFNFYPAKIIMGDAGAMFLGFMLGAISIEGALKGTTALALIVPIVAFGMPILETLFSIVRRIVAGKPFYEPDRDHIHHRLLGKGLTHRQAVVTLYFLSAIMGWPAVIGFETGIKGSALTFVGVTMIGIVFTKIIGGLKGSQASSPANEETRSF